MPENIGRLLKSHGRGANGLLFGNGGNIGSKFKSWIDGTGDLASSFEYDTPSLELVCSFLFNGIDNCFSPEVFLGEAKLSAESAVST